MKSPPFFRPAIVAFAIAVAAVGVFAQIDGPNGAPRDRAEPNGPGG
ncbi:MAG: hypothetical protein RIQ93_3542, partial [Verrucomicrobiota bacterium]